MINGTISPKTYRILNQIEKAIPGLSQPKCAEGLARLQLMLEEPYVACGYYHRSGKATSVVCLDGEMDRQDRKNVHRIADKVTQSETQGYWFIHADDEGDIDYDGVSLYYSHYYFKS